MASDIPEIPHNKSYHLFVCYEKKSIDVVQCIVDNLEKRGIKCCYYERDFLPGQSILKNIYEYTRKSLNMLIVLSEEFENSTYCIHEVEEAINLKLQEKFSLIPIKIEHCSVPERLQHLVYIDVEDDIDNAHDKIIDAMNKKELREEPAIDRNGEYLQFNMKPFKPSRMSFKRYRLTFTESEKAEIWRNNFEVPADLLKDVEDTVNGSLFVKYLHIWRNCYWIISNLFFDLLILVMILFLILFITSGREKTDSFQPAEYALAIGLPLWFLSLIVSILVYFNHEINWKGLFGVKDKTRRVLKADLWSISKQSNTQTGVIFFLSENTKACNIMRYDFKKCKVYFTRHLEEREVLKKQRRVTETNEECTSRLFDDYLSHSCHTLLSASIEQRHPLKNSAKCVCLLVEDWCSPKKR